MLSFQKLSNQTASSDQLPCSEAKCGERVSSLRQSSPSNFGLGKPSSVAADQMPFFRGHSLLPMRIGRKSKPTQELGIDAARICGQGLVGQRVHLASIEA